MPENIPVETEIPVGRRSAGGFFKNKWTVNLAWIFGVIIALYGMVYLDVVLRARSSYLEGEKYWRWNEHPEEKKAALNKKFENDKQALDKKLSKNSINREEYDRQLEILQFDREHALNESSLKYAYVWYRTAYELFSPPESKWVRLSREKAPLAKDKWKEELKAKNVPFEDYMLE